MATVLSSSKNGTWPDCDMRTSATSCGSDAKAFQCQGDGWDPKA